MKRWLSKHLNLFAWSLGVVVSLLAFIHWGLWFNWRFDVVSVYVFFPLLGLLAFSLMWTHYAVQAARVYVGESVTRTKKYFELTGYAVLLFILLHPGLLGWQLYKDGAGLPPGSYKEYIGGTLYGFLLLGVISLTIFILFELRRWLERKNWWRWILAFNHIAMFLIVIHSLKLGTSLSEGWFRVVWIGYATLLAVIYMYLWERKELLGNKSASAPKA